MTTMTKSFGNNDDNVLAGGRGFESVDGSKPAAFCCLPKFFKVIFCAGRDREEACESQSVATNDKPEAPTQASTDPQENVAQQNNHGCQAESTPPPVNATNQSLARCIDGDQQARVSDTSIDCYNLEGNLLGKAMSIAGGRRRMSRACLETLLLLDHGSHPNIVGIHDAMYSYQIAMFYFVLPRATTDLRALSSRGGSDAIDKQADFLQQAMSGILSAVKHLHEAGVAHLDLKPENVLVFTSALDNENQLRPGCRLDSSCFKLADFGVSAISPNYNKYIPVQDDSEHAVPVESMVGTTYYCAPELMIKGNCPDGRIADMWSLGVLILMMIDCDSFVTNLAQFKDLDTDEDRNKYSVAIDEMLCAFSEFSQESIDYPDELMLHSLVTDLLNRDITGRPTAAIALEHEWFQWQYPTTKTSKYIDSHYFYS